MIKPEEIYQHTEDSLKKLVSSDLPVHEKVERVYLMCVYFFNVITESEGLHFTTLFARMSYVITRHALSSTLGRTLHQFRIYTERYRNEAKLPDHLTLHELFDNGVFGIANTLSVISGRPIPHQLANALGSNIPVLIESGGADVRFERTTRFIATSVDESGDELIGYVEETGHPRRLNFNDPGRSDLYRENVIAAIDLQGLPLVMSLVDVEISAEGVMSPRIIVIEPDYLLDVTSVAECYQSSGADARLHVVKKFMPRSWSTALLLGGIANFFLDELVHDPAVRFADIVPQVFRLFPLEISQLEDDELRALLKKAEMHYRTLKQVVSGDMRALQIEPANAFIEPSFYSPVFGIQGRLDLYHVKSDNESEIIELKSGSPYRKNTHGLSSTHYTQTLLYDLMIRAASSFREKPASYILYSGQPTEPLRYAPVVSSIQRESIRLRNEIYLYERMLALKPGFLTTLLPSAFPDVSGFMGRDIGRFAEGLGKVSALERSYFNAFLRLISQEQFFAKVGDNNSDRSMGIASIWLDSLATKNERFAILHDLGVCVEKLSQDTDLIYLAKGNETNPLANIRQGDIAVLYPDPRDTGRDAVSAQVYKGTVVEVGANEVVLRLRNKQVNLGEFRQQQRWVIEADMLDSSFRTMYESLFQFLEFSPDKRHKFLGLTPPNKPENAGDLPPFGLGDSLDPILNKIILAPDYFLLWGPPGTGKTSVILKKLAGYYLEKTEDVILLLAYTNRAVDEMCAALDSLGGDIRDRYLRIGSRISTGEKYKDQLLSVHMEAVSTRGQLMRLLQRQRIIVSTVSSLASKPDIFELLKPSIAIVDEASQILEPVLASILPRFRKFILIGDHKQLPAVVVQPEAETRVTDAHLRSIGLTDTRTSYFERMFSRACENQWDWVTAVLKYQGRMHEQIMRFPCDNFYEGQLDVLPGDIAIRDLTGPLTLALGEDPVDKELSQHRMIFIPALVETDSPWNKANDSEARIVAELVGKYSAKAPGLTLGVITPFRAQIANIRAKLIEAGISPDVCTIDTVERYQGSARDVIIMSTAVNDTLQLGRVVSMNGEGVDRKLNVAVTRAREQFIVVGVESVLRTSALYDLLLNSCVTLEVAYADTNVHPETGITKSD